MKKAGLDFTRRDVLRAGSVATVGLIFGEHFDSETKSFKRIDVHAHLYTEEYLNLVMEYGKTDTHVQRGKGGGVIESEMQKRFAMMDAAGVDIQVLSVSPQGPYFEEKKHAITAARKANDMLADAVHRWPKRLAGLAALPLPHVDEALKELDRALGQLGMVGVGLNTSILGRSIADTAFAPILEELDRRNGVIVIHPAGCGLYSPLINSYDVPWMLGAPLEDTVAVVQLIIRGVPKRYSNLKIINSHMGGALPMMVRRLDTHLSEVPEIPEIPSVAIRRMWYDTISWAYVPALRAAVEALGADRLVLGTDFPFATGDLYQQSVDYIAHAGLRQEDVVRIRDQNAPTLLGLV